MGGRCQVPCDRGHRGQSDHVPGPCGVFMGRVWPCNLSPRGNSRGSWRGGAVPTDREQMEGLSTPCRGQGPACRLHTCSGFCLHTGCGWLVSGEQWEEKGHVRWEWAAGTHSGNQVRLSAGRPPPGAQQLGAAPRLCPWPDWAPASPLLRFPSPRLEESQGQIPLPLIWYPFLPCFGCSALSLEQRDAHKSHTLGPVHKCSPKVSPPPSTRGK